jgi:hypothetical protein
MLPQSRRSNPLSFYVCATCLGISLCRLAAAPAIIITNLPAYGSTDDLRGIVANVDTTAYSVAVFIYVPGYGWVSKPTCAQPLTPIQSNGSWSADITTGGSDALATRVAALLVSTNYSEACIQGSAALPTNVYAQAKAAAITTRASTGVRWLSFSGYDWWVKTSAGQVGPGPNYFSDSTNNVWVDVLGQLHLRITNRSNQWQCAELVSARTFGYGSYRFELGSTVDNLNPNAVLGLFTWSDDPAYTDREIDIECSRWGNASDPTSAQYVVQPYDTTGHLIRIVLPSNQTNSTHLFMWETNRVTYQSLRGAYSPTPAPANVISNWTYTLTVPHTGDENIRLNLWLNSGTPPTDNHEVEVTIRSFQLVPLGTAAAPSLSNARQSSGTNFQFTVRSEFDRTYEIQSSSNLSSWQSLTTLLATNTSLGFQDVVTNRRTFYRAAASP